MYVYVSKKDVMFIMSRLDSTFNRVFLGVAETIVGYLLIVLCCGVARENNSTERESIGVGRDIFISKKLFLVTMRTMRKQFPVSCLTSRRLSLMNQSEAESTKF